MPDVHAKGNAKTVGQAISLRLDVEMDAVDTIHPAIRRMMWDFNLATSAYHIQHNLRMLLHDPTVIIRGYRQGEAAELAKFYEKVVGYPYVGTIMRYNEAGTQTAGRVARLRRQRYNGPLNAIPRRRRRL